ncbi:ATP-binding protein [Sulfidibacter corallicola]|uniref:Oxygen sensor histidine kinase NreB n=1 Tax=Sulfidibacter corallicola TaxID=2818388 RepID=A0A8A4THM0_SULCO|nr:ATP-binding protein [Sulfidibacter corallicola]QTD48311.1 response regulator [Sulfidibacter corallicola]
MPQSTNRTVDRHAHEFLAPRRRFLWILLTLAATLPLAGQETKPLVQRLTRPHPVLQASVILQDEAGFLWLGQMEGLLRYDGHRLIHYRHDPVDPTSLAYNEVSCMLQDRDNQIWVGTKGGLHRYDPWRDAFQRELQGTDPRSVDFKRSNRIFNLANARDGGIWVGTDAGPFHFDRTTRAFSAVTLPDSIPPSTRIKDIVEDEKGNLWVGLSRLGMVRRDPEGRWTRYGAPDHRPEALTHPDINDLFLDRRDGLWVGTAQGLNRYDPATDTFVQIGDEPGLPPFLADGPITRLYECEGGHLWIGTHEGLIRLGPDRKGYTLFQNDPTDPATLPGGRVHTVIADRSDIIWVSTRDGTAKINSKTERFIAFRKQANDPHSLYQNYVGPIAEDGDGNLWVSLLFTGLDRLDPKSGQFVHYLHDANDPTSFPTPEVFSITIDSKGKPWFGTTFAGLMTYDPETDSFHRFLNFPEDARFPQPWAIMELFEDSLGFIWCGTNGKGASFFDRTTERFYWLEDLPDAPYSLSRGSVRAIAEDAQGRLWLASLQDGVCRLDRSTGERRFYQHDPKDPHSLRHDSIYDIAVDPATRVWFGSSEGLSLYLPNADAFRHFTLEDGLPGQEVKGIVVDGRDYLWLGTNTGLCRFNPTTETFLNFDSGDGLLNDDVGEQCYFRGRDGTIFFGGSRGFNQFDPMDLRPNLQLPSVVFTDFKLFNRSVAIDPVNGPLRGHINQVDTIELSHLHPVFAFEFAALEFTDPEENRYAFQMVGFDEAYRELGNKNDVTYMNLDAGTYTFRVKAANNHGVWNETPAEIQIRIHPPPWKSWYAYSLYGSVLLALGWSYIRWNRRKLTYEREVVDKLRRLDRLKDEFLANTSHELRTPLHAISGLAESLLDGAAGILPGEARQNLAMIHSSGKRLLHLVNDLLDFSQIKHNRLLLHYSHIDLHGLTEVVLNLTRNLTTGKDLALRNEIPLDLPPIPADENRILQVLTNLVGNAIKFTTSGSVVVAARMVEASGTARAQVEVSVTDTGMGIPAEALDQIFESFEQADGSEERGYGGTGLGLAITRRLVELHGGVIGVVSELDRGSRFWFRLPMAGDPERKALAETAMPVQERSEAPADGELEVILQGDVAALLPGSTDDQVRLELPERRFRVLIADDEPVNRQVLRQQLHAFRCDISEAVDGERVLSEIETHAFDLVLLDIMMPRLSGLDVCRRVRERFSPNQLPIIFLTAKNQVGDVVTGFNVGANDYLAKPFSKEELISRVWLHLKLAGNHAAVQRLRTQIASDLHDDIGAMLTRLSMASEWVSQAPGLSQKAQGKAQRIGELSRSVVRSFSDIIWSIDARNDTSQHLIVKLRETAQILLGEMDWDMEVQGNAAEQAHISPEKRRHLYLVFKEALNNAVKYAQATRVRIHIVHDQDQFSMVVQDNGIGFDPEHQSAGHGLRNMAMRAARIGGELDIDGSQGTRVTLKSPPL